ncbi:hypothetical protein [Brachybacterium sacelli]|uniref:Uncharacterized protein n=1 Tax=Brachybacterium sacelli TaxID=173364 RepID=A0ABS4X0U0_9MICO|nr:hypothetical protein [Brachybacterium sacelli]MBP2381339.1 hypothetical protein [Brachybacterium sacelli]
MAESVRGGARAAPVGTGAGVAGVGGGAGLGDAGVAGAGGGAWSGVEAGAGSAATAETGSDPLSETGVGGLDLRAAAREAWSSLPVLLLGSALVTLAALATVVASRAGLLVGAGVGLVSVAPTLMALIATSLKVLDGAQPALREHARDLRRLAPRAIGICAVPTLLANLTLNALLAHASGGGAVMLVPTALGATTTVLTGLGAVVSLPMRAGGTGPTGLRCWLLALHVLARSPVPFLAALVVGALGVWVSVTLSNGLFLLAPGPFALVLAAAWRVAPRVGGED